MLRKALSRKPKSPPPISISPWEGDATVKKFADGVLAGDWETAHSIYSQMPTWSTRGLCVGEVTLDQTVFDTLTRRIDETGGQDALAYLIRGAGGVGWAWEARGSGWSDTVTPEGWQLFFDRLRTADQDLHRAGRLDAENPLPWVSLLPAAMGLQIPQAERELRFEQAFLRDPGNLAAHRSFVQCTAGKWSGDDEQMWQFAKDVHAGAPPGSPVHVVVANAYDELFYSEQRSEGESTTNWPEADQLLFSAVEKSVLHPDFSKNHWVERSGVITEFLATLIHMNAAEAREFGARIIPMLGNSPSRAALRCLGGDSDEHKWGRLCHHFGYNPTATSAAA